MKTIEEKNRMIAEFMGRSLITMTPKEYGKLDPNDKIFCNGDFAEDLKYHTSWDWLMPVVQKCKRLLTLYNKKFVDALKEELVHFDMSIEGVYDAVVDFIEWFNEK